ncbi:MAG: hypothetical protein NWE89_00675 [Candidatus Bathyarchaeota archaeon]|nr:hypothetical protein [Candidatus Bathyarchaeota archaeon]
MRIRGDNIAKAVRAMTIKGDYFDDTWEVHMPSWKFSKLFASHVTNLTEREDDREFPFQRSTVVGGVMFYCLLEPKDLTEEESAKWITDTLKARGGKKDE